MKRRKKWITSSIHLVLVLLLLLNCIQSVQCKEKEKKVSEGKKRADKKKKKMDKQFRSDDYYENLGIAKSATSKEIKKTYRKLAISYHPDKVAGNEEEKKLSEDVFIKISEAYAVLSDEKTKRIYDKYGKKGLQAHERGIDPEKAGFGQKAPSASQKKKARERSQSRSAGRDNGSGFKNWDNKEGGGGGGGGGSSGFGGGGSSGFGGGGSSGFGSSFGSNFGSGSKFGSKFGGGGFGGGGSFDDFGGDFGDGGGRASGPGFGGQYDDLDFDFSSAGQRKKKKKQAESNDFSFRGGGQGFNPRKMVRLFCHRIRPLGNLPHKLFPSSLKRFLERIWKMKVAPFKYIPLVRVLKISIASSDGKILVKAIRNLNIVKTEVNFFRKMIHQELCHLAKANSLMRIVNMCG